MHMLTILLMGLETASVKGGCIRIGTFQSTLELARHFSTTLAQQANPRETSLSCFKLSRRYYRYNISSPGADSRPSIAVTIKSTYIGVNMTPRNRKVKSRLCDRREACERIS
ncbi:hypothetical protein C7974DRAFT_19026 [Boeremia exigua]|uniref:uncharacterized protein n=1 Tax=Boeremia exigua TaxID=749465 RepID=UPI001E8CFDB4|nr:uncharacterized protein C7974DRAFT_19026 [Boeremia exigua]KAH6644365.1 hypothetical protein C7974DRAFT_19026 [Boeremia exigua]